MAGLSSSLFGSLGQGVSDIFGGFGDLAEAGAYGTAARIAQTNAGIAQNSGQIEQLQAARKIYQTVSAQEAQVGGAGLAESGSALDLYRSSMQQGSLTKQLISRQTAINVGSFEQEAAAYQGMQSAAKASAGGSFLGGALGIIGAVASFFSDDSIKEDVRLLGPTHHAGINRYRFRYQGDERTFEGVMASEVERVRPDAIVVNRESGLRMVNYAKLGLALKEL
jgi:hypothetical protein